MPNLSFTKGHFFSQGQSDLNKPRKAVLPFLSLQNPLYSVNIRAARMETDGLFSKQMPLERIADEYRSRPGRIRISGIARRSLLGQVWLYRLVDA